VAERFEVEQREEWAVDKPDDLELWPMILVGAGEREARIIAQEQGGEVVHRTVYVWTGEWKPAPEPEPGMIQCGVMGKYGFGPCAFLKGHEAPWHQQADGKRYDVPDEH
jgi:hypothetical protein